MPLVLVPPGEFDMGSTPEEIRWALAEGRKKNPANQYYFQRVPTESPRHRVRISRPFYLAMYLVTQGEYERVMGVNPSAFTATQLDASAFHPPLPQIEINNRPYDRKKMVGKNTSRHPVETVTWDQALRFCGTLARMPAEQAARRIYRLPFEAEWEYACRAGTTTRWYSGDDSAALAECAWFNEDSDATTHPVGQKKPNAWGLYDMHGNVWQWCADPFSADYYRQSPPIDPRGPFAFPTDSSNRVGRGGSWGEFAVGCRSAYRYTGLEYCGHVLGFRVVVNAPMPPAAAAAGAPRRVSME